MYIMLRDGGVKSWDGDWKRVWRPGPRRVLCAEKADKQAPTSTGGNACKKRSKHETCCASVIWWKINNEIIFYFDKQLCHSRQDECVLGQARPNAGTPKKKIRKKRRKNEKESKKSSSKLVIYHFCLPVAIPTSWLRSCIYASTYINAAISSRSVLLPAYCFVFHVFPAACCEFSAQIL